MSRVKYSDEFKAQVVREIVEKDLTIASVAVRCLVFLGQWWKEYCFER